MVLACHFKLMSISFVHNHPRASKFIPIIFFYPTKLMFCGLTKIEFHCFYFTLRDLTKCTGKAR